MFRLLTFKNHWNFSPKFIYTWLIAENSNQFEWIAKSVQLLWITAARNLHALIYYRTCSFQGCSLKIDSVAQWKKKRKSMNTEVNYHARSKRPFTFRFDMAKWQMFKTKPFLRLMWKKNILLIDWSRLLQLT